MSISSLPPLSGCFTINQISFFGSAQTQKAPKCFENHPPFFTENPFIYRFVTLMLHANMLSS